jgi:hypothetical protein
MSSSIPHVVYVLECYGGKMYVGRCAANRLHTRLQEHRCRGEECALTAVYPALKIARSKVSFEETVREHGVANVRGCMCRESMYRESTYSPVRLSHCDHVSLRRQLDMDHAAERCLTCGRAGHWAHACPLRKTDACPSDGSDAEYEDADEQAFEVIETDSFGR